MQVFLPNAVEVEQNLSGISRDPQVFAQNMQAVR